MSIRRPPSRLPVVSLLLALTTFARAAADPEEARVTVSPAGAVTAAELAAVLDVYLWKLDVALPPDAEHVSVALSLQRKGGQRQGFGAGVSTPLPPGARGEVLVAIAPIGGSMSDAQKVRVTVNAFGMVSGATHDNPLRDAGIGTAASPEAAGEGVFNLIGGYEGGAVAFPVSTADTVISLKVASD